MCSEKSICIFKYCKSLPAIKQQQQRGSCMATALAPGSALQLASQSMLHLVCREGHQQIYSPL